MTLYVDTSIWYAAADSSNREQCSRERRDQDFSIVDRTSFAVMRRLGIDDVASLDNHFSVFRFGPRRRQSFNVIR